MFRTQENRETSFFKQFFENKDDPTSVSHQHVQIRLGFMKKVYGLLTIQILATTLISSLIMFTPAIRNFFFYNSWIMTVLGLACLGCVFLLQANKNEYPTNMAILAGFTFMESCTLGVIISLYDAWIVLQAFVLTLTILVGLTVYTFTSKKDFRWLGQSLGSALWVLIIGGLLQLWFRSSFIHLALTLGGAFLFATFIIYDTHLIMKKLSAEEYIMAVITLYLDVVNLFLKILKLLQYLNNKNNDEERRERRQKRN